MPHAADPFAAALQRWIHVAMDRSIRDVVLYTRESGLSMSQLATLFHIHRAGSSGVTDLGDHLGVTSAAASQMLERLVQQGLILRAVDPSDRRVKQIFLTDKGLAVLRESIWRQGWLSDLAASLSASEREASIAALTMLSDRAGHLGQPGDPVS